LRPQKYRAAESSINNIAKNRESLAMVGEGLTEKTGGGVLKPREGLLTGWAIAFHIGDLLGERNRRGGISKEIFHLFSI